MKNLLFLTTILSSILFTYNAFAQAEIVGGEDADIQDYPYQVALGGESFWGGSGFSPYCGASIINEYWILTAAHCVAGEAASSTSIRCGSDSDYAQGGTIYDAAEIISHPNYNSNSMTNDIALIRLEQPISFNNSTQPIVLMCDQQVELGVEEPGQMSWITGWGNTEGTTNSSQLQVVGVPITTESNYGGQIYADMIMAGYPDGGYDSCQGDSGGPMVVLAADGETLLQSGIVSWGYGCADAGYPGVYARVSYFIDWICENTDGAVCPNQDPFCDGNAVYGCTDSSANNYNSDATINDGSCQYSCDNNVNLSLQLDCYGEEISWEIINENGVVVASVSGGTYPGGSTEDSMEEGGSIQNEEICLSAGCYTFIITDSWGDGLDGGEEVSCVENGFSWINLIPFSMTNENDEILFEENDPAFGDCTSGGNDGPCSGSYNFCVSIGDPIYGCTDASAENYNPDANTDDGSCQYLGCTDPLYLEYDPNANIDDGSCINLIVEGCTDTLAENYNPDANIDDNSCEYLEGCTDPEADNYNPNAVINDGSCEYSYSWTPCDDQLWFEDFETYNSGNIDSQSNEWFGWDNTNSGVDINTPGFNNSYQSILVSQGDDVVHEFGGLNTGNGALIFWMMIPSSDNAGAYFNILHDYNASNSNWAFEVYFASSQSGASSYVAADSDVEFNAIYDQWVEVRNEININNNTIEFYYNDQFIHSWNWSDGSAGESNVLGALNLYGYCTGASCVGRAMYDNIELCGNFSVDNSSLNEINLLEWSAYPNPNNGQFELMINQNLNNVHIEVRDVLGKIIYVDFIEEYNANKKHEVRFTESSGTYILNIKSDLFNDDKIIIIQ